MSKYIYLIKYAFLQNNQNWLSLVFSVSVPIAQIAGLIFFFTVVSGTEFSIHNQMTIYYLFVLLVSAIDYKRFAKDMRQEVKEGNYLSLELMPVHPFFYFISRDFGKNLGTIIILIIVAQIVFLIRGEFNPAFWLIFYASALIGMLLSYCLFYIPASFYLLFKRYDISYYVLAYDFFSGKIIPVIALPGFMTVLFALLPFQYASGGLAKQFANPDLFTNFFPLLQILSITSIWIVLLYIIGNILWRKGTEYYLGKS